MPSHRRLSFKWLYHCGVPVHRKLAWSSLCQRKGVHSTTVLYQPVTDWQPSLESMFIARSGIMSMISVFCSISILAGRFLIARCNLSALNSRCISTFQKLIWLSDTVCPAISTGTSRWVQKRKKNRSEYLLLFPSTQDRMSTGPLLYKEKNHD